MTREEIRNKIFEHLKQQVVWIQTNPNQTQQFQLSQIYGLFPMAQGEAQWQHHKIDATAREIIQELENGGFIYEGQAGGLWAGGAWRCPAGPVAAHAAYNVWDRCG